MKFVLGVIAFFFTFSSSAMAVDSAAGQPGESTAWAEAFEDPEEKKLKVQDEVYVPWRTLNLQQVHKETLEEVLAEQDAQADETARDEQLAN